MYTIITSIQHRRLKRTERFKEQKRKIKIVIVMQDMIAYIENPKVFANN